MDTILKEARFDFISNNDKAFIMAFNGEMSQLGYDFGDTIGSGFCWGKYMIIYRKAGAKSKNVFAQIYIRETSIVLRLFFSSVDKHRAYIEDAPSHIKEVFTGDYGNCRHCHNDKNGVCKFRKKYTIDNRRIEKCNGNTFEFQNPGVNKIHDYLALFTEFYPRKQIKKRM